MKILIRRVLTNEVPQQWPEGWPVPRIGETITYADSTRWSVEHVDWYPEGADDGEDEQGEPYVYVIAHQITI